MLAELTKTFLSRPSINVYVALQFCYAPGILKPWVAKTICSVALRESKQKNWQKVMQIFIVFLLEPSKYCRQVFLVIFVPDKVPLFTQYITYLQHFCSSFAPNWQNQASPRRRILKCWVANKKGLKITADDGNKGQTALPVEPSNYHSYCVTYAGNSMGQESSSG